MQESWINLSCPTCSKSWSETVKELPEDEADFTCPDCGTTTGLAEFFRTSRDLEIYNSLTD